MRAVIIERITYTTNNTCTHIHTCIHSMYVHTRLVARPPVAVYTSGVGILGPASAHSAAGWGGAAAREGECAQSG